MIEILEINVAGLVTDRSGRRLAVLILRIARRCAIEHLIAFCHADQIEKVISARSRHL